MKKVKSAYGTNEWAICNANFISGCTNNCKYCYAKEMAIRYKRKAAENWVQEEVNEKMLNAKFGKKNGLIMYPSSHDITLENIESSLTFLAKLLKSGNRVLVVTKANLGVMKIICETFADYKNQIIIRITIGSNNSEILKYWEPGASSYEERFEALQYAYNKGFNTSVSIEPALDVNTQDLVNILLPFVADTIWVGLPNKLIYRLKMNEADDKETLHKARNLIASQTNEWVINLFDTNRDNPKIRWKDSIKKILSKNNKEITQLSI